MRRVAFADAPAAAQDDFRRYQDECDVFKIFGQPWGAWWARYGADYDQPDQPAGVAS